ncbi:MAG: phage tail tape measure protein, partial [Planctomycetaceae bacterium]|nr:phage tail tape measure protein [Planctomycetaceae bacterium]
MPSQGDICAGRAFVEVFTDDSKLQQGLLAINKRMDAWSQQLSGMGMKAMMAAGAVSLPFITGAKVFSSFGDQIEKMTYRTGMSSEALSELFYVAQIGGTDIKAVEISIKGMQKTLSGANDELGSAESKLAKLGLTLSDLAGKTPEDQFFTLLEQLRQIKDENIRAATALAIFGKSGTQLLPMVASGTREIAKLREEARKLGISLSSEDAKAASDLTGDLVKMKTSLLGLSLAFGSAVAPAVRTVTQCFTNNVAAISAWLREHKSLVVVSGLAAVALGAVGVSLLALGGILKIASIGVYGLAMAFGLLQASIVAPIRMVAALGATTLFL